MIKRISLALLLPLLLLAFFLSLMGVQQIQFGDSYYNFLRNLSFNFSKWEFEIPSIPKIKKFDDVSIGDSDGILQFLKLLANFFITLVNAFIVTINVLINLLNVLVKLIEFFISIIQTSKDFISEMLNQSIVCV